MLPRHEILAIGLAALLAAGCASQPPRPTAQMSRASALIGQAENNGARQYAAADIQEARDKLARADRLSEKGQTREALWLANEASVDAQLASARADNGKAQQAAKQVNQSIEALRKETRRGQGNPAQGNPAQGSPGEPLQSSPPQSVQPQSAPAPSPSNPATSDQPQ